MIIFLGDSRMNRVKDLMPIYIKRQFEVIFLIKPGGRVNSLLNLLKEFHNSNPLKVPNMVIIAPFLCDIIERKKENNLIYLGIRPGVLEGSTFPALKYVWEKVLTVEDEIKNMWSGTQIQWVLPHPIDALRYIRKINQVSISESMRLNEVSFKFNDYISDVEAMFKAKLDPFCYYPWHSGWRACASRADIDAYLEFMGQTRSGQLGGYLYSDGSLDGIYPSVPVCKKLIVSFIRKMWQFSNKSSGNFVNPQILHEKVPDSESVDYDVYIEPRSLCYSSSEDSLDRFLEEINRNTAYYTVINEKKNQLKDFTCAPEGPTFKTNPCPSEEYIQALNKSLSQRKSEDPIVQFFKLPESTPLVSKSTQTLNQCRNKGCQTDETKLCDASVETQTDCPYEFTVLMLPCGHSTTQNFDRIREPIRCSYCRAIFYKRHVEIVEKTARFLKVKNLFL